MDSEIRIKPRGEEFTLVQALRGIAAMWVLLFHASAGGHVDALRAILPRPVNVILFDSGHYGVAIFFALSGFVMAHSLRDAPPSTAFLGRFLLRRMIRLGPPYWLSIPILLGFGALSAIVQGEPLAWPSTGTVVAHLFYLQLLLSYPPISPVYWTLTYEVQFYIVLASVLVGARALSARIVWAWPAAWAAMLLMAVIAAGDPTIRMPHGFFTGLWASFFVGVLAYHAPGDRRALAALLLLATVMLCASDRLEGFARWGAVTAVLLAGTMATGHIRTAMNVRWLQFLGAISFSLYLLHNTITGAVAFLCRRAFGATVWGEAVTLVAIIAASVIGAAIYWRVIERTAHDVSRRIRVSK